MLYVAGAPLRHAQGRLSSEWQGCLNAVQASGGSNGHATLPTIRIQPFSRLKWSETFRRDRHELAEPLSRFGEGNWPFGSNYQINYLPAVLFETGNGNRFMRLLLDCLFYRPY